MDIEQKQFFSGKKVLVTGACGTVGSELIKILSDESNFKLLQLVGIDNNESALFFIDQEYLSDPRILFYLGDVRDYSKIRRMMEGVDIVFHTAAYKHVILCEKSPFEAVQTNINGVQNIIQAAFESQVEKVVFTSSDKAVNPTNVMGTTKLMGERLITSANSNAHSSKTVFTSTRFGNVLGSNGSVIQVFKEQIKKGGPLTLTDENMSRFVMSINEAAQLLIRSAVIAKGGEVFVTKMPVMRIVDLVFVMIEALAPQYGYSPEQIEIKIIGPKPGEKMYEELLSREEIDRSKELTDFFVILPAFRSLYQNISYDYELASSIVTKPYISSEEESMSRKELKMFLSKHNLF